MCVERPVSMKARQSVEEALTASQMQPPSVAMASDVREIAARQKQKMMEMAEIKKVGWLIFDTTSYNCHFSSEATSSSVNKYHHNVKVIDQCPRTPVIETLSGSNHNLANLWQNRTRQFRNHCNAVATRTRNYFLCQLFIFRGRSSFTSTFSLSPILNEFLALVIHWSPVKKLH